MIVKLNIFIKIPYYLQVSEKTEKKDQQIIILEN